MFRDALAHATLWGYPKLATLGAISIRIAPKPTTPIQNIKNASFDMAVSEINRTGGANRTLNRDGGLKHIASIVELKSNTQTPIMSVTINRPPGGKVSTHQLDLSSDTHDRRCIEAKEKATIAYVDISNVVNFARKYNALISRSFSTTGAPLLLYVIEQNEPQIDFWHSIHLCH